SWSTIGLELARMGVPVLASTNGVSAFPHDDFMEWGAAPDAYFDLVQKLPNRDDSLDRILHAFRWYHLYHLGTSLNLGDIIPSSNFDGLPDFRVPAEAPAMEEAIIKGREVLDMNHERLKAQQTPIISQQEKTALIHQLRRILHFLYTGEDCGEIISLNIKN